MAAIRQARAVWAGGLKDGQGMVSALTSSAFDDLPVSWNARATEGAVDRTSPEELLAAAHATCFAMALSLELTTAHAKPERLEVTCSVTFSKADQGYSVGSSTLEVTGFVPGIDAERFRLAADSAGANCPMSRALKGVKIEVRAHLANMLEQAPPPAY